MKFFSGIKSESSFTLVELLVVVGILAILTTAVIAILNPAEYLKQARDTTRISDLSSINQALSVLESQGYSSFGTASTTYVSIPDNSSSVCASLGLPALPSGHTYHCVSSTTLRAVDGTGWIPVNFSQSVALAFSSLPVDPTNATSSSNYYTYTPGGSWELTTILESNKYQSMESNDGGVDPALYEVGSDKTLSPFAMGMVGYWKLDGNGNDSVSGTAGTVNGGTTFVAGKGGSQAASFNGSTGYVDTHVNLNWTNSNSFSMAFWMNPQAAIDSGIFGKSSLNSIPSGWEWHWVTGSAGAMAFYYFDGSGNYSINLTTSNSFYATGQWMHIVMTYDPVNYGKLYKNGQLVAISDAGNHAAFANKGYSFLIGNAYWSAGSNKYFNGYLDDIRFYNKVLSSSEIQMIYNATK